MKNFSADLTALLASKVPVYRAHLFAIGPCANGAMIYSTDGQGAITYGGNNYDPVQYGVWSRGAISVKVGLESNSCTLKVLCDQFAPVYFPIPANTIEMVDALKAGLMDNAPVSIYCAYMTTYGMVVGPNGGSLVELKFQGEVAPITKIGLTAAEIEVRDLLYLLNAQVPQMILQASCRWVLYSTGCTLSATNFSRSGAVQSAPNNLSIATTAHLTPHTSSGTFVQGTLTWTSGKNIGLSTFVSGWTPGGSSDTLSFDVPPLFTPQAGDTFTIAQGCNKTYASCNDLQGTVNAPLNYGGTPNVPVPEAAI